MCLYRFRYSNIMAFGAQWNKGLKGARVKATMGEREMLKCVWYNENRPLRHISKCKHFGVEWLSEQTWTLVTLEAVLTPSHLISLRPPRPRIHCKCLKWSLTALCTMIKFMITWPLKIYQQLELCGFNISQVRVMDIYSQFSSGRRQAIIILKS